MAFVVKVEGAEAFEISKECVKSPGFQRKDKGLRGYYDD